jgi:hypothetical protein
MQMKSMLSKLFVVPAMAALLAGGIGIASADELGGGSDEGSDSAVFFDMFGFGDEGGEDEGEEGGGDAFGGDEGGGDEGGGEDAFGGEEGGGEESGGDEGGEEE